MNKTAAKKRRLPAEWETQDGVLLAWPHKDSDWQPFLDLVEPAVAAIVAEISRFERVVLIVPEPGAARERLAETGADLQQIRFITAATNDTWARDFGPIAIYEENLPLLLDFGFNGWGLKFPADLDNCLNRQIADGGLFRGRLKSIPLVLEGGSLESDGTGTLLVTSACLLNPNRNPAHSKEQLEAILAEQLGTDHFLWLDHGFLAGDDTDSHIDTLARLCPNDTILFVACDDPADEHYGELAAMKRQLASFRTRADKPYRLVPLPLPSACYGIDGERMPATYANFLVINDAVLVPTYNDSLDSEALAAVRGAFPDRQVIGLDCRSITLQHGSLHCLTMQLPKGTLA